MHTLRPFLILASLAVIMACALQIFVLEKQRRAVKEDLVELSKIKYGLFNVDEWKGILSVIISKKVEELNFTPGQREEMRGKISSFLTELLTEFEERFYEEKSKSLLGWLQGGITSLTGMFTKMKKDVPVFTEQILDFLNDGANRKKVKDYIMEKLTDYTDKTFSQMDYTTHDRIVTHYGMGDRKSTMTYLQSRLDDLHDKTAYLYFILAVFIFLTGLLVALTPGIRPVEYSLYTLICLALLASGLALPMIEIDARIEEMSFSLLGEPVSFTDQVLYYKSKSILEVVWLMLCQQKWDVWIVGVLVLMFSVLFPVSKLLSSLVYIYRPQLHHNRFIRFMVFRTGKWSMADVMVIAIFMSYIGFTGVLTEQLSQLDNLTRSIDVLTTNKSSLQVGFFLFTSFAILSLLVSHRLQYKKTG